MGPTFAFRKDRCLVYIIHVKLAKISYIVTLSKVRFIQGSALDRLNCICFIEMMCMTVLTTSIIA